MDTKLIKEALELCIKTIKTLHPVYYPNEPYIALKTIEKAEKALADLAQPETRTIRVKIPSARERFYNRKN